MVSHALLSGRMGKCGHKKRRRWWWMVGGLQGSVSDALSWLSTVGNIPAGSILRLMLLKTSTDALDGGWAWLQQLENNTKLGSREYTGGQQ